MLAQVLLCVKSYTFYDATHEVHLETRAELVLFSDLRVELLKYGFFWKHFKSPQVIFSWHEDLADFETCLEFIIENWIYRVGLEIPTVEVRFEHVNVEAQVYVGGRALPSLLNFFVNVLEVIQYSTRCFSPLIIGLYIWVFILCCLSFVKGFLNYLHIIPSPKKPLHILQNVSGIVKPRR